MSLLEHPTAQALLADAEMSADDVRGCRRGGGWTRGPKRNRPGVGVAWWSGTGAKGSRVVRALETWVQAKGEDGRVGAVERLVVIRTVAEESQVWYTLSNASDVALPGVVQAHGRRHGIEEMLRAGRIRVYWQKRPRIIGASLGQETYFIRVQVGQDGVYHGRPVTAQELKKEGVVWNLLR